MQPLRNTVVRIPGRSCRDALWMSKTTPSCRSYSSICGPHDDFLLNVRRQIDKSGAETAHADKQILVLLRLAQGFLTGPPGR